MFKIAKFLTAGSPRRIVPPVTGNFKKNQKWDKSDTTYYGTSTNNNGTLIHHYTEAYINKKKKEKFTNNIKIDDKISQMRNILKKDLKSNDPKIKMMALIVTLVDQAYFRIGNSKSEKNDIRGLHNLKAKHVTINGGIHFNYKGKDKITQHQIVVDKKIESIIENLLKNKKPNDYMFTFKDTGNEKIVTPEMVNNYLKNDLHSPITIHKFRTYQATKLAKEELDKIKVDSQKSSSDILDEFNKVMDQISEKLGHTTANTTIKHYIDYHVLEEFFKKHKVRIPTSVSKENYAKSS